MGTGTVAGTGRGTKTEAVAEKRTSMRTGKGTGTGTRAGTGLETEKGKIIKTEGVEGGSSVIRHIGKEVEQNTRPCNFARDIISVGRRWRLQIASSFGRKARRRLVDVVPRGEQGTKDGREEMMTGTGTGVGTGENTSMGISTRVGIGAETRVGTGERTGSESVSFFTNWK